MLQDLACLHYIITLVIHKDCNMLAAGWFCGRIMVFSVFLFFLAYSAYATFLGQVCILNTFVLQIKLENNSLKDFFYEATFPAQFLEIVTLKFHLKMLSCLLLHITSSTSHTVPCLYSEWF